MLEASLGKTNPRLLNWIGSIDQSGYIREKCLRELIEKYEPGDENRILLRITDWVPQVSAIAVEWVKIHFVSLSLDTINANQELLLYLFRREKLQTDPALKEIERVLKRHLATMGRDRFFRFSIMFRRELYQRFLAETGPSREWILEDPDPFNRLLLFCRFDVSQLTAEEVQRLETDTAVAVRRRLFIERSASGATPSQEVLVKLALEANRSLRELGQFYLKKIYRIDAYEIYRAQKGQAFFFIADYGRKKDIEFFFDGLRKGSRSTQYNCLRAIVAQSPERVVELDLAGLIKRNRKFRTLLVPVLHQVLRVDEILSLRPAFEAGSPYGILSFLRLLDKKSFWVFLDEGLGVLLSDSREVVRNAILRPIFDRAQIHEQLSPHRRTTIEGKIQRLKNRASLADQEFVRYLSFLIKNA
ncbi:MAG: hypothetical protein SynsKO_29690 [Synoicihabitans sp.]